MELISGTPFSGIELPVKDGYSSIGNSRQSLDSSARVPIFALIAGGGEKGFKSATPITDTPKANPNSSVIIGYLKHE